MAKSKKQRMIEAKDRKDSRKILMVVSISVVIFLILLFLMFQNS